MIKSRLALVLQHVWDTWGIRNPRRRADWSMKILPHVGTDDSITQGNHAGVLPRTDEGINNGISLAPDFDLAKIVALEKEIHQLLLSIGRGKKRYRYGVTPLAANIAKARNVQIRSLPSK